METRKYHVMVYLRGILRIQCKNYKMLYIKTPQLSLIMWDIELENLIYIPTLKIRYVLITSIAKERFWLMVFLQKL